MKRAWFCIIVLALPCIYAARDQKYYRILGISDDADEQTIKKAYRKAAMKWHPDRNQDKKEKAEEKFREIAAAYETLSDPEKKRIYDQLGEEGLKQNAGPGGGGGGPGGQGPSFTFQGDPFDIFSQVFGGANPFGQGGAGGGGMGGMGGMMGGMGGMPGMGGMGGMPGGGGRRKRPSGQQAGGGGGLYDGEPAVVKVDSSNFPGKSDTQAWLLEFYAPWCGHCRNLVPKWSKVANSLKGIVKVGAVNCDEEKQLCAQHGVQGYPTIKSWAKGRLQDYNGDRSAAALKTFGLSLLSSKAVKTLNKPAQVMEFLKLGESKDSKSASWGANVILFTSKSDTAPLTKSLASQFEGKIAFGESRASNKALAELFKVTSYPTMLAFCNGDTGSVIRYQGDFKAAPLAKFMREFQSGKKCQKMIKIDANTDLSKFRVSQLKELLQERDVNCIECTEKKDFVKRLQELLQDRTEL